MSVLADEPRWPRHGTLWGHLVSDSSLDELHEAAARAGLHPRSFDLDHYDWPLSARADLERIGVRFVDSGSLTRALIRSGLRVPMRDRAAARGAATVRALETLGMPRVIEAGGLQLRIEHLIAGERGHAEHPPAEPGWVRAGRETDGHEHSRATPGSPAGLDSAGLLLLDALASGFVGQVLARNV